MSSATEFHRKPPPIGISAVADLVFVIVRVANLIIATSDWSQTKRNEVSHLQQQSKTGLATAEMVIGVVSSETVSKLNLYLRQRGSAPRGLETNLLTLAQISSKSFWTKTESVFLRKGSSIPTFNSKVCIRKKRKKEVSA